MPSFYRHAEDFAEKCSATINSFNHPLTLPVCRGSSLEGVKPANMDRTEAFCHNRYIFCSGVPQPPLPHALPDFDTGGLGAFPGSAALQRLEVVFAFR